MSVDRDQNGLPIIHGKDSVGGMLDKVHEAESKIGAIMEKQVNAFKDSTGYQPGHQMQAMDVVKLLRNLELIK